MVGATDSSFSLKTTEHDLIQILDPLFFLHHAQLDRMWWKWQLDSPQTRLFEYTGLPRFGSTREASLDDSLTYGGFIPDISVRKVMDTEGGLLCYRY